MHTNAVIKVCSRAKEIDSVWDIVSRLPERGAHAADNRTFTIVLNAIRIHALTGAPPEETRYERAHRIERSIVEGRQLWDVVIKRWRSGDLLLDEELTCAMGHLLLIGARPRDWDDVLSLVQQTAKIPRLIPRLGTAARESIGLPRLRAPDTPQDMKNNTTEVSSEARADLQPGSEFDPVDPKAFLNRRRDDPSASVRAGARTAFAQPGNSLLSLTMESCLKLAASETAKEYFSLLTDPSGAYALTPDRQNLLMYLRILRHARDPHGALDFLTHSFKGAGNIRQTEKDLRIALGACARDSTSKDAPRIAMKLLRWAGDLSGNEPEVETLNAYLDAVFGSGAAQTPRNFESPGEIVDVLMFLEPRLEKAKAAAKEVRPLQVQNALADTDEEAMDIVAPSKDDVQDMENGEDESDAVADTEASTNEPPPSNERRTAVHLFRNIISGYDRAIHLQEEIKRKHPDRKPGGNVATPPDDNNNADAEASKIPRISVSGPADKSLPQLTPYVLSNLRLRQIKYRSAVHSAFVQTWNPAARASRTRMRERLAARKEAAREERALSLRGGDDDGRGRHVQRQPKSEHERPPRRDQRDDGRDRYVERKSRNDYERPCRGHYSDKRDPSEQNKTREQQPVLQDTEESSKFNLALGNVRIQRRQVYSKHEVGKEKNNRRKANKSRTGPRTEPRTRK